MRIRGVESLGTDAKNANQAILELLNEGEKTFSEIKNHLITNGLSYSRKGLALRLDRLSDLGFVTRHRYKQGHYLYMLSKKGEKDIALQAKVFSNYLEGFLRAHLPPFKNIRFTEEYFIDHLVKRVGIFVLFSFLYSLRLVSQKPELEKPILMNEWLNNSFSFRPIYNYFMDKKDAFIKFKSSDEAFEYYFLSHKKQAEVNKLEDIFRKKFPSEYNFWEEYLRVQSFFLKSELASKEFQKTVDKYMKEVHKNHKEYSNLKPSVCIACALDKTKPPLPARMLDTWRTLLGI